MQHQTNLIYESFLFEFPKAEFSFPDVCEEDSSSMLSSSLVNFSPDHTCLKTDNSYQYDNVLEFDCRKDWTGNVGISFKSCLSPDLGPRVEEASEDHRMQKIGKIGERIAYSKSENLNACESKIPVNGDVLISPIAADNSPMKKSSTSKPQILTRNLDNWSQYIEDVTNNGIRAPSVRAGRPRHDFDTSYPTMLAFYEDYLKDFQSLIQTKFAEKRSDTFRNTIFSYLKKLPIKLRERSCSVSDPKSKKFSVYLNAFLVPFVNCFLPFFGSLSKVPKVELFLYFICICYPEDKCVNILNTLVEEGAVSKVVA